MKVSIVIPIYNVEQYIEDCVRSVICQNYEGQLDSIVNENMETVRKRSMDFLVQHLS